MGAFLIVYSTSVLTAGLLLSPVLRFLHGRGWLLQNYRGTQVPCPAGLFFLPVLWACAVAVILFRPEPGLSALYGLLALGGSLVVLIGWVDDRAGESRVKGWRGHLGALFSGRLTAGLLKISGIGLVSLGTAALRFPGQPGYIAVGALVCSLAANSLNSLDLRPGRALKAYLFLLLLLVGLGGWGAAGLAAPVLGAALVLLWPDLNEEAALGDAGANLLGWHLGVVALFTLPATFLPGMLVLLVLFQVLTERYSLSGLIEKSRILWAFDAWGRPVEAGTALPRANIPIEDRTCTGRKRG